MSSVDVLKEWIELLEEEPKENTGNKDLDFKLNNGQEIKINILKEALLALEQKEKLIKRFEKKDKQLAKREKQLNKQMSDFNRPDFDTEELDNIWGKRYIIKEVLELMK